MGLKWVQLGKKSLFVQEQNLLKLGFGQINTPSH